MKKTKLALLHSVVALLLCVAMLIGSTFAWFTDSVTSGINSIIAGNLDVELEYRTQAGTWKPLTEGTNVFAENARWEPGYTEVVYLRVSNKGNLALKYQLGVNIVSETPSINIEGDPFRLSQFIYFGAVADQAEKFANRTEAVQALTSSKLISDGYSKQNSLQPNGEQYVALVVYMPESVGNDANHATGQAVPTINLGISLVATQHTSESDSFGSTYDEQAQFPELNLADSVSATAVKDANNKVAQALTMASDDNSLSANIPVGVQMDADTDTLLLTVREMTTSGANITLGENEILRSLDVHIAGVAANNTVPMQITIAEAMMPGLNIGNYKIYHMDKGVKVQMTSAATLAELDAHNEFYYDPATGNMTLSLATFSEVALVADTENAWNGTYAEAFAGGTGTETDPYLIANADQLAYFGDLISNDNENYGDKHYKLLVNINLGGEENANAGNIFYPIGYHAVGGEIAALDVDDAPEFLYFDEDPDYARNSVNAAADGESTEWYTFGGAFKGTFDGNGHKISNIYQNTWQLKGNYDGNYWNAAMGLFGYVNGGTVKNLSVDSFSSDGEFTPTGVIAAYAANATFENIAITNCNPRVYNTGNGGIVGIGGNSGDPDTYKLTFTNITIDNTNKISALWGSWDVACGGLVGMFRGAGHVYMTNCHVGAQIDVFNDVCGNYQYYWYRYSGMMIGTNKNMTTDANGYTVPETEKFHAENCTVHFGDWNNYYYCELVANSLASYTHDHQFSRLDQIQNVSEIQDENGNWKKTGNFILMNGKTPTNTCYHIMKDASGNLYEHKHDVADATNKTVYETVNGETVLKENNQRIYLPFNQLFTGYGWGVKHIPVHNGENYAFAGITILDREVANSVTKFESSVTELMNNKEYKLSDIFSFVDNGVELVPGALTVTVTNVDEKNPVSAVFNRGISNWENSTLMLSGTGTVQITIQDYYFCTPTTITVNVVDRQLEVKFESKFTGDFLYRVGNASGSTVALSSLFKAKDGAKIGNVSVTVAALNGTAASGSYTPNATWTNGKIQFSGTGIVKVTITDDDYCIPTELILEVVDATNITSAVGTTSGGNFVLLCDVNTTTYVNYWNCILYGNGFTYSLNGAPTAYNSKQGHGILITKNATLDNLVIIGDVYNSYGAYTTQDYYNSAVDVVGDTTIQNCYIANCAAPVSTREDVTIINTTLYGGTVANLIIKSGTATLEDVTTANFDDGRSLVGMGIVVHSDATESAKLVLNGTLKQYNFINEQSVPTDTYAKNIHTAMFGDDCNKYHFGTSPNRQVNAGIISMTSLFNAADITDNANTGYVGTAVTLSSVNGYVYTQPNTLGFVDNNYDKTNDPHFATTQGAVAPDYSFDYTSKNYQAKQDGNNDYCYEENGVVYISMDAGDTFNWDTSILSVSKVGQTLPYTVSMNGTDYSGKSIAFNTAGDYDVTYTYTDSNNYCKDKDGNIITYSQTYTKTVKVSVAVVEAATKHAEFTFGSSNTASTTVTIGNNTYVMPNVNATSSTIGSTTVDGQTIYYPIVEIVMSDGKTSHTSAWYAYFPVFSGAVTITDYKDNGLGDAETFGSSTQSMPAGLSIVGDPAQLFKYQSSSTAGTSPVVKNNILVYSSPSISAKRSEYNTVIQYSYKDNAGATYYYYIGYHAPAQSYSSICVAPDTLITLADGTQEQIQNIRVGDAVLAWNFYTGAYEIVPVTLLQVHNTGVQNVLHLYFEDGTELKILGEHGVFDADLNSFVFIDEDDVDDYIGHSFVKQAGDSFDTVKLVGYQITTEDTSAYTILSYSHYNVMAEGMFTVTPAHVGGNFFNPFDVGEDMKYDVADVRADIEQYGLYTYEDFDYVLTYEQFVELNIAHFKVSVGKGYITYDGLIYLIENFVNNADYDIN